LIELLKNSDSNKRDGIAWTLARSGNFDPCEIVTGADEHLRRWISYIVGYGKDHFDRVACAQRNLASVEAICNADPEVYFAASVLWQIVASWVYNLKEY